MSSPKSSEKLTNMADKLQKTAQNFTAAEASMTSAKEKHLISALAKNKRRKESIQKMSKELIAKRKEQFKREFNKG